jgi:hypothetical protein
MGEEQYNKASLILLQIIQISDNPDRNMKMINAVLS